jgi:hypothetical protein
MRLCRSWRAFPFYSPVLAPLNIALLASTIERQVQRVGRSAKLRIAALYWTESQPMRALV